MASDSASPNVRRPAPGGPVLVADTSRNRISEQVYNPTLGSHPVEETLCGPADEMPPSSPSFPFLHAPVAADEIGRLGNYRVLRLLGKGGMAYVFLAEDIGLKRLVALKVMKPDLDRDPSACQRFLREAQTVASIKHEHLVTVFQVGQENRVVYLAMEWLKGETIEDWIVRTGPAKVPDILRISREIAAGLAVIHRRGLIHRDIKPGNLWLEEPCGHVKILDFGLARHVDDDANFTQSGTIVGTPAFMSPEQARGEKLDARSDLFSLGGVLYYLCTGARPFTADNTLGLLTALAILDPAPIGKLNPHVPKGLSDLIMRMLAKDPAARPNSADTVVKQLSRIETGDLGELGDLGDLADSDATETDFACFSLPDEMVEPAREPKTQKQRSRVWSTAIGSIVALVVCIGIVAAVITSRRPNPAQANEQAPRSIQPPTEKKSAPVPVPVKPKVVFLTDLKPSDSKDWIKQPPKPPEQREFDPEGRGPPPLFTGVRIHGESSPHGIFMHPPRNPNGGDSWIAYALKKQFDVFQADVSLNDGPMRSETALSFRVYGDGRLLWKSREVWSQNDAQTCNVSIKNVDVLTIEIGCAGDPHGAHAAWIEPRISK
jgi:eukaryotic-like serine/threonine-protein kinase